MRELYCGALPILMESSEVKPGSLKAHLSREI